MFTKMNGNYLHDGMTECCAELLKVFVDLH